MTYTTGVHLWRSTARSYVFAFQHLHLCRIVKNTHALFVYVHSHLCRQSQRPDHRSCQCLALMKEGKYLELTNKHAHSLNTDTYIDQPVQLCSWLSRVSYKSAWLSISLSQSCLQGWIITSTVAHEGLVTLRSVPCNNNVVVLRLWLSDRPLDVRVKVIITYQTLVIDQKILLTRAAAKATLWSAGHHVFCPSYEYIINVSVNTVSWLNLTQELNFYFAYRWLKILL